MRIGSWQWVSRGFAAYWLRFHVLRPDPDLTFVEFCGHVLWMGGNRSLFGAGDMADTQWQRRQHVRAPSHGVLFVGAH